MLKPTTICVLGPTASGKTALGVRLAEAFFGEVINADARQLYQSAPIGTGIPRGYMSRVPGEGVLAGVPHHLFAVSPPSQIWTASDWCKEVELRIAAILVRGHVPCIVGGTGMYIRALTEGFVFSGAPHPDLRASLLALPVEDRRRRLLERAPEAERLIDMKNPHRVLRALERVMQGDALLPKRVPPSYQYYKLARWHTPEALRSRIEATIQRQLEEGWVDEVRQLLRSGVSVDSPLMQSIGFRTIASAIEHDVTAVELREAIIRETWAYARRQMTWLRKEPQLHWVQSEEEAYTLVSGWLASSRQA